MRPFGSDKERRAAFAKKPKAEGGKRRAPLPRMPCWAAVAGRIQAGDLLSHDDYGELCHTYGKEKVDAVVKQREFQVTDQDAITADLEEAFTHEDANDIRFTVELALRRKARSGRTPSLVDVQEALMDQGMPESWATSQAPALHEGILRDLESEGRVTRNTVPVQRLDPDSKVRTVRVSVPEDSPESTHKASSPFDHRGDPTRLGQLMAKAGELRGEVQGHAEAVFGFNDADQALEAFDAEQGRLTKKQRGE